MEILFLSNLDTLVIRKVGNDNSLIFTKDSVVLGRSTLIAIVNHLVKNGYIDAKVIQGMDEEYHTA